MLGFYFFFLRQPASPASDFILFSLALVWGALFLITVRNSRQPYIFHSIYSVGRMGGWVAGWLVWSSNVHKVHTNSRPFRLLGFFSDCFFFLIFLCSVCWPFCRCFKKKSIAEPCFRTSWMCVGSIVMIEIHSTYYWQVSVLYGKLCYALFISQYSIPSYESVSLTEFDTDKKKRIKTNINSKKEASNIRKRKKNAKQKYRTEK